MLMFAPAKVLDGKNKMLQTVAESAIIPQDDCVWKYVWKHIGSNKTDLIATIIANKKIKNAIEFDCLRQILNASELPGVSGENIILNPDCNTGYGVPIGSVIRTKDLFIPGSVGYDIKCSMSLLQLDVPASEIEDKRVRRDLINKISHYVPTGMGKGQSKSSIARDASAWIGPGFNKEFCEYFNIPEEWIARCEDARHGDMDINQFINRYDITTAKLLQLGTYGSGNHFGECNIVHVNDKYKDTADAWGLKHNHVAFLSHCGSRGLGHRIATYHFKQLQNHFRKWNIPLKDKELVYIPINTPEALEYEEGLVIAGNFATLNHMLINKMVLKAFQEVIPGTQGQLIYYISHNFVREEYEGRDKWYVHRKGATRAFPAGHHSLKSTPFYKTGHPILLPGDPIRGSAVMVAKPGAKKTFYSVNHGAGRVMSRSKAKKTITQKTVDNIFDERDVLTNARQYPIDESHLAYKDFDDVLDSVTGAGLADVVANLQARFVIKA